MTETRRQKQAPALQFAAYSYHRADMHTKRFSAQREKRVPNSNLGGSEGRSPLTSFRRASFARPRTRSPRRGACRPEADLRYLAGFAPENFRRNFSKTGPKRTFPQGSSFLTLFQNKYAVFDLKKEASIKLASMVSGIFLISRAVASQVPSAIRVLTSVFGMGTGVTLLPSTPEYVTSCEVFANEKRLICINRFNGFRRLPTLPDRCQSSTIGVKRLNFCVRYGYRWNPLAIVTGISALSRL